MSITIVFLVVEALRLPGKTVGDVALAVLIGVVIFGLAFAWDNSKRLWTSKFKDADGIMHYNIHGFLSFGSVSTFHNQSDLQNDPEEIIVDLSESQVTGLSATEH